MHISFSEPLQRAYEHMRGMLFAPFDFGKWLVIGFGCWLTQLTSGGFNGSGGIPSWTASVLDDAGAATLAEKIGDAWEWPLREGTWLLGCGALAAFLVVFLLLLIPLVIWLSSRGHFIFLDNVVRDRPEIGEPWVRLSTQGDSLFLWRIGFLFAALFLIVAAALPLAAVTYSLQNLDGFAVGRAVAMAAGVMPLIATVLGLALTHMFLTHFVVPIMYREGLTTNAAWGRFLPLLRAHLASFLIYALFIVALWIGISIGLMLTVLFTCCIAAIPLVIPYIGTVALLPVYVVFRAYSVEFLAQMLPALKLPAAAGEPPPAGVPA